MPDSSKVEVVWVSLDVTEEAYLQHLSELGGMYAVPWKLNRLERLADLFGVQGLPALVVVDAKSGAVLTGWGREDVETAWEARQRRAASKGWNGQTSQTSGG